MAVETPACFTKYILNKCVVVLHIELR